MKLFKKIRKGYCILQQKVACWDGATIRELEIKKNPYGKGIIRTVKRYCAVTGEFQGEEGGISQGNISAKKNLRDLLSYSF